MKRSKTTPRRPRFEPLWTEADGIRTANDLCATDAIGQAGTRLAALVLARTPEELIRGAALPESADGGHPAISTIEILAEAVSAIEARLEILKSAHARVLSTACFVHGVRWR